MTVFIIIIIVILLFAFSSGSKTQRRSQRRDTPHLKSYPKITVEIKRDSQSSRREDSIIDVTGKSYRLDSSITSPTLSRVAQGVPYWQHHYVYSFSEIHSATPIQQRFYKFLKGSFLKGVYIDLEGNTNYAFILFFDLLEEFLKHKDQAKVEAQLDILAKCYPKTSGYAIPELIKRLEILGHYDAIQKLREKQYNQYQSYSYDSWKLGVRFRSKLKLEDYEVKLLNRVWQPMNNFGSIEYCCTQIAKLYLKTISELEKLYSNEDSSLDDEFNVIADLVARKHFNYRANSSNYKYSLGQTKDELYSMVFKICENTVRELYDHKRKLSISLYANATITQEFHDRVASKIEVIHSNVPGIIDTPDESTEIELNMQNTGRWKSRFDHFTKSFNGDIKQFDKNVKQLAALNMKNPALENIYFEASKYVAKVDKSASLHFYIHYIYADLKSSKFDNRQLTKTVQKSLFSSSEQLKEFENIVGDLIATKDINKAIEEASQFYVPKRKRIKLNSEAITEARKKHSGTVELLNEYLKDEHDDIETRISSGDENSDEVQILIPERESTTPNSKFSDTQMELLQYFQKQGLILDVQEIDNFVKSRGLLKNQLVDSINETCYETLDDVLIEEESECYSINPEYFQKILTL